MLSIHFATAINLSHAVHAHGLPKCGSEPRWCPARGNLFACINRRSWLAPVQATPLETFWPVVVIAIAIPEIYSVFTFRDPATENQVGAQVRWEAACGRRLCSCRVKSV